MSTLLLTRSLWSEPPRLRHQVAQLLLDFQYTVLFAERPALLGTSDFFLRQDCREVSPHFFLLPQKDLLHHQMRVRPALHRLNALWTLNALKRTLCKLPASSYQELEMIINFNYDAFWLRRLFPNLPITTIINDDFESMSCLPFHGHLTWALSRTCVMSDRVLAVSTSLCDRLSSWCSPELFLPWATSRYVRPALNRRRNVLLYWGYINDRLDFKSIVDSLPALQAAGYKVRFIGPVDSTASAFRRHMHCIQGFEWLPACTLESLDTSDCVAALLPYRLDCKAVRAAQLPNKALQLLSRGLPLLASDLPYLHSAPFVLKYGTPVFPALVDALHGAIQFFDDLQPSIASFVRANGSQQRLAQLLGTGTRD